MVTHDPHAAAYGDRLVLIRDGLRRSGPPTRAVDQRRPRPKRHPPAGSVACDEATAAGRRSPGCCSICNGRSPSATSASAGRAPPSSSSASRWASPSSSPPAPSIRTSTRPPRCRQSALRLMPICSSSTARPACRPLVELARRSCECRSPRRSPRHSADGPGPRRRAGTGQPLGPDARPATARTRSAADAGCRPRRRSAFDIEVTGRRRSGTLAVAPESPPPSCWQGPGAGHERQGRAISTSSWRASASTSPASAR